MFKTVLVSIVACLIVTHVWVLVRRRLAVRRVAPYVGSYGGTLVLHGQEVGEARVSLVIRPDGYDLRYSVDPASATGIVRGAISEPAVVLQSYTQDDMVRDASWMVDLTGVTDGLRVGTAYQSRGEIYAYRDVATHAIARLYLRHDIFAVVGGEKAHIPLFPEEAKP